MTDTEQASSRISKAMKEAEAQWSFDLRKFHGHLGGDDDFIAVLRGHLYLEHVLIEFMKEALAHPDEIDVKRVLFPMKVSLCVALGILAKELVPPINKMNEFRNHTAHNLDFRLSDQQKRDFFFAFPPHGRELILANATMDKTFPLEEIKFGHMVKVLTILLDIQRQQYVEWKRKREAAFADAKKVLDDIDLRIERKEATTRAP